LYSVLIKASTLGIFDTNALILLCTSRFLSLSPSPVVTYRSATTAASATAKIPASTRPAAPVKASGGGAVKVDLVVVEVLAALVGLVMVSLGV